MQYLQIQNGKVNNGVGVGHTVNYPDKPASGTRWKFLRACILHSLKQKKGKYATAISGIEITIKESSSANSATTDYTIHDSDAVSPGGSQPLRNHIPDWAKALAKETIKFGIQNVHPVFGVLSSAGFHIARSTGCADFSPGTIRIRDTPKYVPRNKVRLKPLVQTFELGIALLPNLQTSNNPIGGPVDYKITVEGITHDLMRSLGPTGVGKQTGTVSCSSDFMITWK